jgi:hypothetical protein
VKGDHVADENELAAIAEAFKKDYARLVAEFRDGGVNIGCVECSNCVSCTDCVFCKDCVRCHRSRYSVDCHESQLLTHCERCRDSRSLAYCQDCSHCGDSNYLVSCSYCFECDYCFGCVGLIKQDFHILNKKYSRSEYFKQMAKLRAALGIAAPAA